MCAQLYIIIIIIIIIILTFLVLFTTAEQIGEGLTAFMHIDPQPVGQQSSSSWHTSLLLQPKSMEQKTPRRESIEGQLIGGL